MRYTLPFVALVALACGLSSTPVQVHHHRRVVATPHDQTVVMLIPMYSSDTGWTGRYAYQGDDLWYYYNFPMSAPTLYQPAPAPVPGVPTPPPVPSPVYNGYRDSLPPSGNWSVSKAAPAPEDVVEETQMSIEEGPSGAPVIAGWEVDPEGTAEEGNMISAPSNSSPGTSEEEESESSSEPASEASSDGGASGGDGGGGDGGGGE